MPVLSSILPKKTTSERSLFHSVQEVLNKKHLDHVARTTHAERRECCFSFSSFLLNGAAHMSGSTKEQSWTMKSFYEGYCEHALEDEQLSRKCVHQRLNSMASQRFFEEVTTEILDLVSKDTGKRLQRKLKQYWLSLSSLMDLLGVDDIVLIDGTELPLRPGCGHNFPCQGKGRVSQARGPGSNCAVKVHVAFSLTKRCYVSLDITDAVHSERECVHCEDFHNTLFIMDRGYVSDELERKIVESGNQYLVRGKSNAAGVIVRATSPDGTVHPEYSGKKVSEIAGRQDLDLLVKNKNGIVSRVMIYANPNVEDTDDGERFVVLRTSLKHEFLNPFKLYNLYRMRWQIELFNKANKTGNGLMAINSDKKPIIIAFLLMSIIASLIKSLVMMQAIIKGLITCDELSMLQVHMNLKVGFTDAILKLSKGRTTKFQVFKELCLRVVRLCKRSKCSKRDRLAFKDLEIQINNVRGIA